MTTVRSRSTISTARVYSALHTPGGPVREWVKDRAEEIKTVAEMRSPVNHPLNALHRGGKVGIYKASWYTRFSGTNQHGTMFEVGNRANHAIFVEDGRRAAYAWQRFSWRKAQYAGPRKGSNREWYVDPRPGRSKFFVTTNLTNARPGRKILGSTTFAVFKKWGIVVVD